MATAEKLTEIKGTRALEDIINAWLTGKRRVFMEGGTWASKTWSAMQFLRWLGETYPQDILSSVVSETMPHLKRGAIRDFEAIMGDSLVPSWWNKTDFIYRFPRGSKLEFFSVDMPAKMRGGRRDILFINEANNVSYEAFYELDSRTRLFTLADWNPTSEFYFHQQGMVDYPENVLLHYTYKDALDVIPVQKVADIEKMEERDPNWWRVYGLGLLGKIEGLVYPHFEQVDGLPDVPRFYGLDFGFSVDPTVLTAHALVGDRVFSQELIYDESGLTNQEIAYRMQLLKVNRQAPIYCDPNEPKSVAELRQAGFNAVEAVKGRGSVEFGIQRVNQLFQHWTKDSLNCIKEQRNFRYVVDREGKLTENTTHKWSHGMDSLVAGTLIKTKRGDVKIEDVTIDDIVLTRAGWKKVLLSGMTSPAKEILTLTLSNGKSITGTADHEIWIKGKGFVPLDACRYADIIEVCPEKQLSIMGRNITATLKLLIGLPRCILNQDQRQSGIFIARYGWTIMAIYQRGLKFITKMVMHLITQLRILNVCPKIGTYSIIPSLSLSGSVNGLEPISENISKGQTLGIGRLKAKSSIVTWGSLLPPENNPGLEFVKIADENLQQRNRLVHSGFVQTNVNRNFVGNIILMISKEFVLGVVRLLRRINIGRGHVAPIYVLNVSEPHKRKQAVYDLTTEDMPEFYANGMLVHNSRRYAVASHGHQMPIQRSKRSNVW